MSLEPDGGVEMMADGTTRDERDRGPGMSGATSRSPGCSFCNRSAVVFVRYSGRHLCAEHFNRFVLQRAQKEFRAQIRLPKKSVLVVAISGGKDSAVALDVTVRTFGTHRDKEIMAVTVDEGIEGYRPPSISAAREFTERIGVDHHVFSFRELYGATLDEILSRPRELGACSYCGVLRRQAINLAARKLGGDVVVTGLNLDDTAQGILMNIARGDVERLARMGPHTRVQRGLIPRVQPLRRIPEKETYLYALLNRIPFYDGECPYAVEAQRGLYREVINMLEEASPGTRHAILNTYDTIRPLLLEKYEQSHLRPCEICGEPTVDRVCRACSMLISLGLEPRRRD